MKLLHRLSEDCIKSSFRSKSSFFGTFRNIPRLSKGLAFALMLVLLCLSSCTQEASAQEPVLQEKSLLDLSLEEILNITVKTGNTKELTIRETPGILTVYTAEDLRKTGASDLMDVLQLVPGFEFGSDIQTSVGLGMRGLWASEGKIALFIDDMEINELGFGTIPWGCHFPIELIDKVEIIRGPGSSIFGGCSQYGVIRVITRAGNFRGLEMHSLAGQFAHSGNFRSDQILQHRRLSLQAGNKSEKGYWHLFANLGSSQRSGRMYEDFYSGQGISFEGKSAIEAQSVVFSGAYKNFSLGFLGDNYSNEGPDYYGSVFSSPLTTRYKTLAGYAGWKFKPSESFSFQTQLKFKNQNPWYSNDSISWITYDTLQRFYISDRELTRISFKADATYQPDEHLSILIGSEFDLDHGRTMGTSTAVKQYNTMANGKTLADYSNLSGFLQANYKGRLANLTLGLRGESHSLGYKSFVPRFGITRAFNRFHFKLMASNSFRNPAMLNLKLGSIRPEMARILEFETGYMFSQHLFANLNLYDITVNRLIYYFNDPVSGWGGYINSNGKAGSRGAEFELRVVYPRLNLQASYSTYSAAGKNEIPSFSPDPDATGTGTESKLTNYYLGFARHKLAWNINYRIFPGLGFNFNGNQFSKRYEWVSSAQGIKEARPATILNATINLEKLFASKADLSLGVYNLLHTDYRYITPYSAGHAAIPSAGREFRLQVTVHL